MVPVVVALVRPLVRFAIVVAPWVSALFLLYWLETRGVWTPQTPYRGLASVAVLAVGMGLSFLVYSVLQRRRRSDD